MRVVIREAVQDDFPWIEELAVDSSVYGIPANRSISNEEVKKSVRPVVHRRLVEAEHEPWFVVLVAFDGDTKQRLGYLMLDLDQVDPSTGERQGFIYDLAVAPEYWGRYVVHKLVDAAVKRTAREGMEFLVGEITADNERSLLQALRLGFIVERYRVAIRCSEDGKIPFAERPFEERAHVVSRLNRRKRVHK